MDEHSSASRLHFINIQRKKRKGEQFKPTHCNKCHQGMFLLNINMFIVLFQFSKLYCDSAVLVVGLG